MSVRTLRLVAVAFLGLSFGRLAGAADPWEADAEDGGPATRAYLHPGQSQHGRDLEGGPGSPDQDWVFITNASRHSYEARAVGGPMWALTIGGAGAKMERLAADGTTVLQAGTDLGLFGVRGHGIRWLGGNAGSLGYLRVTGPSGVAQGTFPTCWSSSTRRTRCPASTTPPPRSRC